MVNVKDTVKKEFGTQYPEKILQFGEGNFLRAFADWMVDTANEEGLYKGSIVISQPIERGLGELLNKQDCVYTVAMSGMEDGKAIQKFRKVTSVSRVINPYHEYDELMKIAASKDLEVIISNTTEAGIAYHAGDRVDDRPPVSYPAKLAAVLYHRYKTFNGAKDKGLLILPVELIDNNGENLKRIVLQYATEWELEKEFITWLNDSNEFTSTLVDRIVTGYPRDTIGEFEEKLGYKDNALVTCESFNLWVIQGDKKWADKLPIHKTSANVIWTDNVKPYKKRKVRILNGSHTSFVPCAYIAGYDTVLDFFTNSIFGDTEVDLINNEIKPVIDLPKEELDEFAQAVMERFRNPHIKHFLYAITLNNCSKFTARCLPTIKEFVEREGKLPKRFAYTLAGFIRFYDCKKTEKGYEGHRDSGESFVINDEEAVTSFFCDLYKSDDNKEIVHKALSNKELWGGFDITSIDGLENIVLEDFKLIKEKGMENALKELKASFN
jgi:tagaturonate reductase